MTTTTARRPGQIEGLESLRIGMTGDIAPVGLAKDAALTVPHTFTDVDVCKTGLFWGLGGEIILDDTDVAALVERFDRLLADVQFQPVVRQDHWSGMGDVVGYVTGLKATRHPDPADGGREKLFLQATFEITEQDALDKIVRRTYRNRSSEFLYYETNRGDVYSLVFGGFAFVDIPAVEGLGEIKLSRGTVPGRTKGLTVTEQTSTPPAGTEGTPAAGSTTAPTPPATTTEPTSTPPVAPAPSPAAAGGTDPDGDALGRGNELARMRSEIAALRAEAVERHLVGLTSRAVANQTNTEDVKYLLSHEDAGVRDAALRALNAVPTAVPLGAAPGMVALSTRDTTGTPAAGSDGRLIALSASPEDAGEVFSRTDLSAEQIKQRDAEYAEWARAQRS